MADKRQRVIFVNNINNGDAIRLSRDYPRVIIFRDTEDGIDIHVGGKDNKGKTHQHYDIYFDGKLYTNLCGVDKDNCIFTVEGNTNKILLNGDRLISTAQSKLMCAWTNDESSYHEANEWELASDNEQTPIYIKFKNNYTITNYTLPECIVAEELKSNNAIKKLKIKINKPTGNTYQYIGMQGYYIIWVKGRDNDNNIIEGYLLVKIVNLLDKTRPTFNINWSNSLTLFEDFKYQLQVIIRPVDYPYREISWISTDPNTATIDSNGIIFTHNEGFTYIQGTHLKTGKKLLKCKLTVKKQGDYSNTNTGDNTHIYNGDTGIVIDDFVLENIIGNKIESEEMQEHEGTIRP